MSSSIFSDDPSHELSTKFRKALKAVAVSVFNSSVSFSRLECRWAKLSEITNNH